MVWQELYIACVLETNSEELKALIHETENAIISRLQTLETPDDEHREIARASASLLVLKSERLSWPGHPDSRNPQLHETGSEKIREHPPANAQSCAEYEQLFDKCLDALTRWTRLHGFDDCPGSMGTPLDSEVWRAERNYAAAFSALQHSRCGCLVCEDGLRVHETTFRHNTAARPCPFGASEVVEDLGRGLSATPIKTAPWRLQTIMPEIDHQRREIGQRTGVLELLAGSLVVHRLHRGRELDHPFKNGIGRSCLTHDRAAY